MTAKDNSNRSTLFIEVEEVIKLIRPSIQADGGDIELLSVDDEGIVSIRFLGACIGCPSLDMTLQSGIESTLKERVQGITLVKQVD
jgi:Fe-S cluster biogenesis protein NfuA